MANIIVTLPAPAGNGSGAAVDVSSMGAAKTVVVGGAAQASITIEFSVDAAPARWAPLKTVSNRGKFTIPVAARWMRATVSGYRSGGAPDIEVGADDAGALFANMAMPAGTGVGASTDVSALPAFKTVQIGGPFRGTVIVEFSEDNTQWGQTMVFTSPGAQTKTFTAAWMRVRRSGVPGVGAAGTPIANVGACSLGGGGAPTGPTNWQSFDYVATGNEAAQFTVTIPVAQPDALYQVLYTLGTVDHQFGLNVVGGTQFVGAFDVAVSTAPLTLGDVIHFSVFNAP